MRVCVCVCACVRACVRACVCVCVLHPVERILFVYSLGVASTTVWKGEKQADKLAVVLNVLIHFEIACRPNRWPRSEFMYCACTHCRLWNVCRCILICFSPRMGSMNSLFIFTSLTKTKLIKSGFKVVHNLPHPTALATNFRCLVFEGGGVVVVGGGGGGAERRN